MSDPRSQLLHVLHEAASQDFARMRQAEELLIQWENEPSFFATLQDIFYDRSVDHDVRFLGGIYLKNGINRFWRKTAKNPINPAEKANIRQRLLNFFDEPSTKLTWQNALIAARIARLDYPREWPELLPTLMQVIETTDLTTNEGAGRLIHDRALTMLYEVLYELSGRILSTGRRQFAEIAPRTFQTVAGAYMTYSNRNFSHLSNLSAAQQDGTVGELNITSMCVKCMRILMVSGIKDVHQYEETKTFIGISLQHLQKYMECLFTINQTSTKHPLNEALTSLIEDYGTMYLALQKYHPVSAALCPAWLEVIRYYWQCIAHQGNQMLEQYRNKQSDQFHLFQPILLQAMLLLKGTIKNPAYTSTTTDDLTATDEEKASAIEAGRIIHSQFLTTDFVNACAEVLISNYMLLTPDDFEKWEDDPEAWVHSVDAENWEFELRPCAEATFLCLLSQNREQLCPIILNLVEKVATVNDYHALLLKDGVYAAIGLGVQSLYGRLDFENFVMNRLIPEVMNKDPTFKILRRRIAWVLGKWVTEGISADGRVAIYEALLQMMGEEEDLVVRITSAHSLKMAIDDWDFDISLLLPYLDRVMDGLLRLLAVVEESDTVMKLVSDLNTVMDRTGRETIPYASKIIQLLMPLWDRGQSEPLFQQALIVTFTKISAILEDQAVQLFDCFITMIQYAVDRTKPAHVYLLEDALDLWWTLLQCAPNGNTQLFLLFPVAIDLMDYDTENLRKIFKIIESYLLLNHQLAVQQCGSALLSRLGYYVMNSREEVASSVAHIIDLFIKVTPLKSAADGLVQSGVLGNVLQTFLQGQMYAYALVTYMSLFARLAIHDANFVIQFITAAGQQLDPTAADFFGDVLDKWMDKFDNISNSRTRKLTCMGFTSMLMTKNLSVMARLPHIMAIWSDVIIEITEATEDDLAFADIDLETDLAQMDESPEKARKQELQNRDPVLTADMLSIIRQTLTDCQTDSGYQQYINSVDPTILEQVNKQLTL